MSISQIDQPALVKIRDVRTIKLRGQVHEVPLLVLVDSEATRNFISMKLVKAMGWPIEETSHLKVKLGDGFKVMAQGIYKKIVLNLGSMKLEIDAWLFDLDEIDIVLEMSWLASVGGMWVDWE